MNRVAVRIAVALATAVMGLVLGVAGAFLQSQRTVVTVGDVYAVLPWGAVLAGVTTLVVIRLVVIGTGRRTFGWLVLAGWLVATLGLATVSPSGDIAVSGGTRQIVYLLGVVVVGSALASVPVLRGTARAATSS